MRKKDKVLLPFNVLFFKKFYKIFDDISKFMRKADR